MKGLSIYCSALPLVLSAGVAGAESLTPAAVTAFHDHRYADAMAGFLKDLQRDPGNREAHTYIRLIARAMDHEHRKAVYQARLGLLRSGAGAVEAEGGNPKAIEAAWREATAAQQLEVRRRQHARCEEARIEMTLGRLLHANDLVLSVLAEDATHAEAQRLLTDLQSVLYQKLRNPGELPMEERFALEGFYAYGQADDQTAAASWQKARAMIDPSGRGLEGSSRLKELCFAVYEQRAKARLNAEARKERLRAAFAEAITLYDRHRYADAVAALRGVALQDPNYPQLAAYLVQAEAAAEEERTRQLSEAKKAQIAQLLQDGLAQLEHEHYPAAEAAFQRVLDLDPTHPQAGSYLSLVRAELKRRTDPRAAQQHYEAGLIAYASGKLDEALREWRVALKLNAHHDKARNALAKVEREIALDREPL